jgi:hypothetical protein
MRLSRVAVASAPWSGTDPCDAIRVYLLKYYSQRGAPPAYDPANDAPLCHHSFLRSIQMEGRCGIREMNGEVPDSSHCAGLPPTAFEYEPGQLSTIASVGGSPEVHSAPPHADDDNRVFTDVRTAAVVDIDRDGLPDFVQSWPLGLEIDPNAPEQQRTHFGYLNTGGGGGRLGGPRLTMVHQCIDPGGGRSRGTLTFNNPLNTPASFLSPLFGVTVLGPWGDTSLLWSRAGQTDRRDKSECERLVLPCRRRQ